MTGYKSVYFSNFIVIVSLFSLLLTPPAYAVKETKLNTKYTSPKLQKETEKLIGEIEFDKIFDKAKEHSYDIKIADFEVMISKTGITTAKSQYYPKLIATAGTEYTHNLRDYTSNQYLTTVGDLYVNPYTRYQTIFGLNLQYKILIFDEATSALDYESERIIKDNLNLITKGRTTIIIAHRLSTIRDCDLIVCFDSGKIVEAGTHEELLRMNGYYSALEKAQQI